MIRIAICDDSPQFLQTAVTLINTWSGLRNIPVELHTCSNGDELLAMNVTTRLDIVFLDIIMPLLNGIETARELRRQDSSTRIIFLTSSPEFALDSYSVKAQGYLLKPVTYEKIQEALDDCSQYFAKEPENIILKTPWGYQKLYLHNIEYIEAQNKKVIFYLDDGDSVQAADPLNFYEHKLTLDHGFFKCHRSYLVYLKNVLHFNSTQLTTRSGRNVPIARGFAKPFKKTYFSLMFEDGGESYAADHT